MSGNRARRRGGRADGAGAEDGHDGGSHGPSRRDGTGDGGGGKRGGKSEHARRGPDEDNWRSSDPASGPSDGRRGVGGSQRKAYAGGDEPPRGGGRERGERGKATGSGLRALPAPAHGLPVDIVAVVDVLQLLACAASNDASRLSPHGISNLVVGFANLAPMNVRSENLMPVLASEVVDKISAFESSHLSQTSWAFAKCSLWNDVLVSTLGSECIKKMDTFSAHSLSHLSWAMAQWATTDQELRDALVARVKERVHDLAPNPLATMTSSFASLQVKDPLLYQAISMAVREKIHSFKATDLATMVNAFAKAGIADEAMLEAAAGELLGKLPGGLRPAEMCDVAWAFSQTKGQFSPAPLMGAISDEAFQRLPSFQSQDVANLLWSLAVSQVHHKPLMSEIGNMVANNMERYTAQHLASIARAYGALLLKHTRFMELLPRHVHVSLQNQAQNPNASVEPFKASHLSNIAFAFATLKVPCEALMKYMAPTIAHNIEELRPMFLSRCARAYRALSVHCPDLMAAVVRESTRKLQTSPKDFATRDLRRVVDSLFASGAIRRGAAMETELAERMRKVSDRFCGVYSGGAVVPVDDCRSLMEASKDLECSLAGTPMLISSLHICVPSRDFMRRCFAQTWKSFDGAMGAHLAERGGEYTAVEMDVCVGPGGQRLHDWIVRCKGHRGPVTGGDEGRPLPRLVQFLPFSLFRSSPAQCIHMPSFYSSPVSSHVSFVSSSSPFPFPFSSFLSSSSSSSSSSSTCGGT
ncbi:unnamed protein product [Prorocentrum cordatum]|uniref:RNA-editing substrate-binding complex 6 protein domain-containing protein n=1 Tax=Prorocentrum cordatum TaxID=2364126 RepID=A0ABN9Y5G0_9DINO|nr:unnamed protein product [Polarella glacialis]